MSHECSTWHSTPETCNYSCEWCTIVHPLLIMSLMFFFFSQNSSLAGAVSTTPASELPCHHNLTAMLITDTAHRFSQWCRKIKNKNKILATSLWSLNRIIQLICQSLIFFTVGDIFLLFTFSEPLWGATLNPVLLI